MPTKYSHSAVISHYADLGLINNPPTVYNSTSKKVSRLPQPGSFNKVATSSPIPSSTSSGNGSLTSYHTAASTLSPSSDSSPASRHPTPKVNKGLQSQAKEKNEKRNRFDKQPTQFNHLPSTRTSSASTSSRPTLNPKTSSTPSSNTSKMPRKTIRHHESRRDLNNATPRDRKNSEIPKLPAQIPSDRRGRINVKVRSSQDQAKVSDSASDLNSQSKPNLSARQLLQRFTDSSKTSANQSSIRSKISAPTNFRRENPLADWNQTLSLSPTKLGYNVSTTEMVGNSAEDEIQKSTVTFDDDNELPPHATSDFTSGFIDSRLLRVHEGLSSTEVNFSIPYNRGIVDGKVKVNPSYRQRRADSPVSQQTQIRTPFSRSKISHSSPLAQSARKFLQRPQTSLPRGRSPPAPPPYLRRKAVPPPIKSPLPTSEHINILPTNEGVHGSHPPVSYIPTTKCHRHTSSAGSASTSGGPLSSHPPFLPLCCPPIILDSVDTHESSVNREHELDSTPPSPQTPPLSSTPPSTQLLDPSLYFWASVVPSDAEARLSTELDAPSSQVSSKNLSKDTNVRPCYVKKRVDEQDGDVEDSFPPDIQTYNPRQPKYALPISQTWKGKRCKSRSDRNEGDDHLNMTVKQIRGEREKQPDETNNPSVVRGRTLPTKDKRKRNSFLGLGASLGNMLSLSSSSNQRTADGTRQIQGTGTGVRNNDNRHEVEASTIEDRDMYHGTNKHEYHGLTQDAVIPQPDTTFPLASEPISRPLPTKPSAIKRRSRTRLDILKLVAASPSPSEKLTSERVLKPSSLPTIPKPPVTTTMNCSRPMIPRANPRWSKPEPPTRSSSLKVSTASPPSHPDESAKKSIPRSSLSIKRPTQLPKPKQKSILRTKPVAETIANTNADTTTNLDLPLPPPIRIPGDTPTSTGMASVTSSPRLHSEIPIPRARHESAMIAPSPLSQDPTFGNACQAPALTTKLPSQRHRSTSQASAKTMASTKTTASTKTAASIKTVASNFFSDFNYDDRPSHRSRSRSRPRRPSGASALTTASSLSLPPSASTYYYASCYA
ncbi:MAG: hypothetical protein M1834_003322 [Cirrosporium novae-zelandiae]|nr:MAG: hypothetical protein M1834_003322 [Cirrosporium novae-zelandiae]